MELCIVFILTRSFVIRLLASVIDEEACWLRKQEVYGKLIDRISTFLPAYFIPSPAKSYARPLCQIPNAPSISSWQSVHRFALFLSGYSQSLYKVEFHSSNHRNLIELVPVEISRIFDTGRNEKAHSSFFLNNKSKSIEWEDSGRRDSPVFPYLCRFLRVLRIVWFRGGVRWSDRWEVRRLISLLMRFTGSSFTTTGLISKSRHGLLYASSSRKWRSNFSTIPKEPHGLPLPSFGGTKRSQKSTFKEKQYRGHTMWRENWHSSYLREVRWCSTASFSLVKN